MKTLTGYRKHLGSYCEECDETRIEYLHVHHIDKNHFNNDPNNLITLCRKHHSKRHPHPLKGGTAHKSQGIAFQKVCIKCNYNWFSIFEKPKACPSCKSYKWSEACQLKRYA